MRTKPASVTADICLILEGTYPYTMGGVSGWTHELINTYSDLTFSIVALISADAPTRMLYELPSNVISLHNVRIQRLPTGKPSLPAKTQRELFAKMEEPLLRLQSEANLEDLKNLVDILQPFRKQLGQRILLDSKDAWNLLYSMYRKTLPKSSFLDYFWSWRGLYGGLFGLLLMDVPPARAYHAICTGYAGLLLARAHLETSRPCILTEHGIYTNERQIEIASADWLDDPHSFDLSISEALDSRELKDFWIDSFRNYSRICYQACTNIVTLYEGNLEFQRMNGAEEHKLRVIPNGIDCERYAQVVPKPHPPTVALIGRVVPIKDIKTFIKAIFRLHQSIPELQAFIIGPDDEDLNYAEECRALVTYLKLESCLHFTGKVNIMEYLGKIDVIVLSSLSEAQPLVILEAGAAGIPTVATDVGSCREIIFGNKEESPPLGAGGDVVALANPKAIADALLRLLTNKEYYLKCQRAITQRVHRYYPRSRQRRAYATLYQQAIGNNPEAAHPARKQKAAA